MNNQQMAPLEYDFDIWYKSKSESFLYINSRSRTDPRWLSYREVLLNNKYSNSIIKPINMYAMRLSPAPKLLSINKNEIVLQQTNHAEFFLLQKDDGLYNIDRPWIRQYYLSDSEYNLPEDCFDGIFRFYVPWVIDEMIDVKIEQPEDSPFYIYPKTIKFNKIPEQTGAIDPDFVEFHFKSVGSHIVQPGFGKIPRFQPMFNMRFEASDIIVERVRKFYEHN